MKIEFKNEDRMKRYLSWRLERKITESEFKECKDYFIETLEYIQEERDNKMLIREGASLTAIIDDEDYEVWVIYDNIVKNSENVTLIDFDYEYDDFIDSLPEELRPN